MFKWITKKRVFMVTALPILGVIVAFLLRWLSGPAYTTSVNQSALYVFGMGSILWSILALFIGFFLYSKCSTMNHIRFICGVFSVLLGASMPWLIGAQ
ncbi:hypothetical protein OCL06_04125 [Alteromonas sp. ASW11-19]|uniref:Uncharacterized protein n=1 Tax=Alteromonas salexigens TaxID=2982530 RepID=A0ABT2VPC9_9ALTE|nr:hypothetical protein [Alteromonas salexigens]